MHPLVVAIPKFIQLGLLLLSLRPMDQSRRGVTQTSAPVVFVRLGAGVVPPTDEEPHAVIDPLALMATKAD
jgi:transketolase C-terminal domain/subunit